MPSHFSFTLCQILRSCWKEKEAGATLNIPIAWTALTFTFLIKVSVGSFKLMLSSVIKGKFFKFCGRGYFGTGYSSWGVPLLQASLPWVNSLYYYFFTAPSLLLLLIPYTSSTSFRCFSLFLFSLWSLWLLELLQQARYGREIGRVNEHRSHLSTISVLTAVLSLCVCPFLSVCMSIYNIYFICTHLRFL